MSRGHRRDVHDLIERDLGIRACASDLATVGAARMGRRAALVEHHHLLALARELRAAGRGLEGKADEQDRSRER